MRRARGLRAPRRGDHVAPLMARSGWSAPGNVPIVDGSQTARDRDTAAIPADNLAPMPTLSTKVINSLGWVFSNILLKNALQFVRGVILWRILAPGDFGLNQMAWLAINMFTLLQ